jgi:3'-5' exoribonuclease
MAKKVFIDSIQSGTILLNEPFSIKEIQKHTAKNGDPYYRVVLQDKTGTLQAKIWKDAIAATRPDTLAPGDIAAVDMEVTDYQGQPQGTIRRAEKLEEYDMNDFVKMTSKNLDELFAKIVGILETIKDTEIRGFTLGFIKDPEISEKFKHAIAAELVHHDYIGGLMEHLLEMYALAEALMPYYPRANRSIVLAGIFFHDIGKLYELGLEQTKFIRTLEGYLIGHITIGVEMFIKALPPGFSHEKKIAIEHIILSHHKEIEYGAVVRPATMEAIIVSMVDYASTHTRQFQKEMDEGTPDLAGFGKYHPFQKTRIYHNEYEEVE